MPLRVEAAGFRGRAVSFSVIAPWTRPARMVDSASLTGGRTTQIVYLSVYIVLIVGGAIFARRNVRLGRGDRRGAVRVAFAMMSLTAVAWLFEEHHVADVWEQSLFFSMAGWALWTGGLVWIMYLALEPYVRRNWSSTIVSWSRVLSGDLRDPLVGRDILIGGTLGVVGSTIGQFGRWLPSALGSPAEPLWIGSLIPYFGTRYVDADLAVALAQAIFVSLILLFLPHTTRGVAQPAHDPEPCDDRRVHPGRQRDHGAGRCTARRGVGDRHVALPRLHAKPAARGDGRCSGGWQTTDRNEMASGVGATPMR